MTTTAPVLYVHPAKQDVDLYDQVPAEQLGRPYGLIPMGVPALVNLLRENGIDVRGVNFPMEKRMRPNFSLRQWLRSQKGARIILIDLHWYEHSYGAISVAKVCKEVLPDAWTVIGGLTASAFASEIMRDHPEVDFIIRGDAEKPLLHLARRLLEVDGPGAAPKLDDIPNLSYRVAGELRENERTYCAGPEDFAALNFIDIDFMDHEEAYYVHEYLVIDMEVARRASQGADVAAYRGRWLTTARGCNYSCSYCGGARMAHAAIAGRKGLVVVPPETIISQIKHLLDHGVIQVSFSYDLGDLGESYWRTLFRMLRKEGIKIGLYNEFFQLPPQGFMKDYVRTADMEHSCLALNPYSGSEKVRRLNGKRYGDTELIHALDELNYYNIPIIVYFSLNLPGEDEQANRESVELGKRIFETYPSKLLKILNSCHTVEPFSPMVMHPENYGVKVEWSGFKDWYTYCRETQLALPGSRTGEWRGFHTLNLGERSIEAMADAWDAARAGREASWWPLPPSW